MKIECPNCGKTYQLPPEVISRIIQENTERSKLAPSPTPLTFDSLHELSWPKATRKPAGGSSFLDIWRIAHPAKILMLIATLLWPVGIIGVTYKAYQQTLQTSVDMGNGTIVLENGAGPVTTKANQLTASFLAGLICPSVIWAMAMAFLGSIWLVTRG